MGEHRNPQVEPGDVIRLLAMPGFAALVGGHGRVVGHRPDGLIDVFWLFRGLTLAVDPATDWWMLIHHGCDEPYDDVRAPVPTLPRRGPVRRVRYGGRR